jgi:hypothetical protein
VVEIAENVLRRGTRMQDVPDLEGGSRSLFMDYTELPGPHFGGARVMEQEENYVSLLQG